MDYYRLSQAEIDMLLGGTDSSEGEALSESEMDTVGEIGTTAMNAAATSLSELLAVNVSLTNPRVSEATLEQFCTDTAAATYIAKITFQEGLNGSFYLVFQESDMLLGAGLIFGNDGSNPPETMGEMELSAIAEAVSQLSGNMMTALSSLFKKKVISEPIDIQRYDLALLETPIGITLDDHFAKSVYRFEIGTLSDSVLTMLIPVPLAKDMVRAFEATTMPAPAPTPTATQPVTTASPRGDTAAVAAPPASFAMPQGAATVGNEAVNAQPVSFAPFGGQSVPLATGNLSLILDVPLQITVELGRTRKQIKDVLELGAGSIIELDKLTGDPVDILINGKAIAEGEVVIIDENFAVRITKIKNLADRLGLLQ
ncbi:MAG: flagellar motor switch phosphatase FliY [Symbiobacteriaceae bacterium]|nr:flagellar motor switch phosphatase FliY [Symbiobacteriaceae bacterium]